MRTHRGLDQALEGIKAVASFVAGAVMLYIVYTTADVFLVDANNRAPGGFGGAEANAWINTGLDQVLPAAFVLLIFFGLVARGVIAGGRF